MRLTGEVIGADTPGSRIILSLHLIEDNAPEWHLMEHCKLSVPHNDKTAKAYHIGRRVIVHIDPA